MSGSGEEKLLKALKDNPFVLAPMAGITDCAFRSFMHEMGASVVVSELVSATGLKFSSERTRELMRFSVDQHPVGVQIFGEDLEHLAFAAKEIEQMGADFVDINFGCPVTKVVKKGAGSAALKDLLFLRKVLRSVKSAVKIPVTIKVRTGWDQDTRNTIEVARIAADEGITWVAIHGRTRAQAYTGEADWNYITEVKKTSLVPILGNGDLTSAMKANHRLKESGCDGVLIGRGCLKNPWIFKQSLDYFRNQTMIKETDFLNAFDMLTEKLHLYAQPRVVALQLKKFAAWFSAGYPESSAFRKEIFALQDLHQVQLKVRQYFGSISGQVQADTSQEAFLMGGHG